ncbi:S49 family peptidase [Kutzneria chonburiensis]|uniref:S49 family peptidase n=1 Tax=Kutzneria chonburiensis TaxID=1483604 RepID=A0ABV6N336_9PSEU|nr:S49 family peptidase [Kutzneria chonburiensis]
MSVPEKLADKLAAKLPLLGDRVDRSPVVAVVRLHGVITPTPQPLGRGAINLNAVEPALTKAFAHDRLQAVALAINSPGGSPTQSALVGERIRELAAKKNVPVLAFCEDVAASGGYWLACAADEIYAHRTSMVGSIGVITAGFGLTGLLERFGVERRVYTAGEHKHRLDPFSPVKDEDIVWLKGLQGELHTQFTDWVKQRRGDKLAADPELFTGEVWTGAKALELGLVDGLGSLREIVAKKYPEADIAVAEPRKPLLARLGIAGGSSVFAGAGEKLLAAIDAVEQRAHWSRFGL